MNKFELIDKERTIEEVNSFSQSIFEQSTLNIPIPTKNNVFLTSLLVGASLVSNDVSAKPFKLESSNSNVITITSEYNKSVNENLVQYINSLNYLSKFKISKKSLVRDILSFKSLTESWDGYGAIPLEIDCATNALQLIDLVGESTFCTVSNFYPNPNGTITFEWENAQKETISLEVGNITFSYFVEMASLNTVFFNNKSINAKEAKKLSEFIKAL